MWFWGLSSPKQLDPGELKLNFEPQLNAVAEPEFCSALSILPRSDPESAAHVDEIPQNLSLQNAP